MYEYNGSISGKHNIWAAKEYTTVDAKTKAGSEQDRADGQLRFCPTVSHR